jgi:hypothetical protein
VAGAPNKLVFGVVVEAPNRPPAGVWVVEAAGWVAVLWPNKLGFVAVDAPKRLDAAGVFEAAVWPKMLEAPGWEAVDWPKAD